MDSSRENGGGIKQHKGITDTVNRINDLNMIIEQVFILLCSVMVLLANVGFIMKETGCTNINSNQVLILKTILVVATSAIMFFIIGYGLATNAQGGILGSEKFFGFGYDYSSYTQFVFFLSLCIKMSVVATGSIAERVDIGMYVFFAVVTSAFIFPVGLAWLWQDGWLANLGFVDHGGAALVHLMGGTAGFIGAWMMGPRL